MAAVFDKSVGMPSWALSKRENPRTAGVHRNHDTGSIASFRGHRDRGLLDYCCCSIFHLQRRLRRFGAGDCLVVRNVDQVSPSPHRRFPPVCSVPGPSSASLAMRPRCMLHSWLVHQMSPFVLLYNHRIRPLHTLAVDDSDIVRMAVQEVADNLGYSFAVMGSIYCNTRGIRNSTRRRSIDSAHSTR